MPRRYNLRKQDRSVKWIEDDTLGQDSEEEEEDSDYEPPSEEEESEDEVSLEDEDEDEEMEDDQRIVLPKNAKVSVQLHIHSVLGGGKGLEMIEEDDEEEEEEEDDFLDHLLKKYGGKKAKKQSEDPDEPALELNEEEEEYFEELPKRKQKTLNSKMKSLAKLVSNGDVPYKFRVLELPVPDSVKAAVIKKIDAMNEMNEEGNEVHKLRTWVDGFLKLPFGTNVPLPVKLTDGPAPCAKFLSESRITLDKAVYGMAPAKTQIMQILAQWIANPSSVGNVVALKGPMGVGKTSFARNGISEVLKRPFQFISLGGAADAANFVGHSYTYEGAVWGRIADALMHSRCMNPVFYFDELDKVSTTAHGEEIVSLLIHLTDRSQNSQFHDRYFAGVDLDLSQCLFVFSFNDESKVHPVLKDRMQVITCSGYTATEKETILSKHVLPQVLERNNFKDLSLTKEAIKYLIEEHSKEEEGVRTLIRAVETLVTRINLLRIADEETAKSYKFYMPISMPFEVDVEKIKHILTETEPKKDETWRSLYT
jgi:ATP-dependent Lon protease